MSEVTGFPITGIDTAQCLDKVLADYKAGYIRLLFRFFHHTEREIQVMNILTSLTLPILCVFIVD